MARNQLPMMNTGGGVLGKLVGTVITIAILVFAVKHPTEAANAVSAIVGMLGHTVDGLASFFGQLHG